MSPLASESPVLSRTKPSDIGGVRRLIVTIDGPAGTGKSSVARDLSIRLGVDFLDTGAMYRAATALALDSGIDLKDHEAVADLARSADLRFDWTTDPPTLYAFGRALTQRLRDHDVTTHVSNVSSIPEVRRVLVERQRRIGEAHQRLVSEGRDQGSVVFYDADVKIYLDAAPRIRAQRRAAQLRNRGADPCLDTIEREILERDRQDSMREVGPLVCPHDAEIVDTSHMDQSKVVERLSEIVSRRVHLA